MNERPLGSNRWVQLQELFEAALNRAEEDWPIFLASRCADEPELADQVLQLLIADRNSSQFLTTGQLATLLPLEPATTNNGLQLQQVLCERFELFAYLGEGGMGQVYEAIDLELNQRIAIKAIRPEIAEQRMGISRFKREVYATRKINHPNVCRTFDLECHSGPVMSRNGSINRVTFFTMELLKGETLAERIRRTGPLPGSEVREVGRQIGYALQAAHAAGVIHCDLKPSNVFLTEPNGNLRVVVTDFGIAKITQPSERGPLSTPYSQVTLNGQAIGTPAYMAPEQFERGQSTQASDIYSFGLILYEALTGKRLFPFSRSLEPLQCTLNNILGNEDTEKNIQWNILLSSCLQTDPGTRPNNIQDVLDVLEGKPGYSLASIPPSANKPATQLQSAQPDSALPRRRQSIPRGRIFRSFGVILFVSIVILLGRYRLVHSVPAQATTASVVVLPFDDPGGEADLKVLGNNFTASLTNDLARFSGLIVASQTAFTGLGSHSDFNVLGQSLHVHTVVNGSITRTPHGLLVQVALVDTRSGAHWGKNYLRKDSDLASLDKDVSIEIAYLLRRDLEATGRYVNQHHTTRLPAAQKAFSAGEAAMASSSLGDSEIAASHFQQAIDADPEFSQAYERLADCYLRMANKYLRPEASFDLRAKSKISAFRSLELNDSPAAFIDLAKTEVLGDFDWERAEQNFNRAIHLDPIDILAHATFAFYVLTPQARFAEARAQYAYAHGAPSNDIQVEFKEALGEYFARQYQSSLSKAQKLRHEHPKADSFIELIANDYLGMNKPSEAVEFLKTAVPQTEDGRIVKDAMLGIALARLRQKSEARRILDKLVAERKQEFGLCFHLAALAAALGDRKSALMYLNQALVTRETSVLFIGVDTLMDPLRPDPRFQRLLLEMNLNKSKEEEKTE